MNSAEASNSFSPLTLLKWVLERIHISRGMLKIRLSVMELGRFTLRGSPEASRNPVLIILLGNRERNGRKLPGRKSPGSGSVELLPNFILQLPWRRFEAGLPDAITSGKIISGPSRPLWAAWR